MSMFAAKPSGGKRAKNAKVVPAVEPPAGERERDAGRKREARIYDAIASVGLTGLEDRPIGTLSGGQTQRMLFARLLLQDAPVILLDEPFTALDSKTTADLLEVDHLTLPEHRRLPP
jgi:ABC-type Mn2+/Zn2+ transport system ATPase subunit